MGTDDTPAEEVRAHHEHHGDSVAGMIDRLANDLRREIRESRKQQTEGLGSVIVRLAGIESRMQEGSIRMEKHALQIAELAMAQAETDQRVIALEKYENERSKREFAESELARERAVNARDSLVRTLGSDGLRVVAASMAAGLCALGWFLLVTWIRSKGGG
jgi:hypothetical protein